MVALKEQNTQASVEGPSGVGKPDYPGPHNHDIVGLI